MHALYEVCSSPIWARRVLAGGPFRDDDALLDRADRVLAELPDSVRAKGIQGSRMNEQNWTIIDRVLEIVPATVADRSSSRTRFKFYRDRGYELSTHNL